MSPYGFDSAQDDPLAKFVLYGSIVGEGFTPPVQAGCFIIAYGYLCRARRSEARETLLLPFCFDKTFRLPCRAGVNPRPTRVSIKIVGMMGF